MRRKTRWFQLTQEMSKRVLTFLMLCFTSAGFGEDFKTTNGKEYKDATINRVEPDGIMLKTKSGIIKVYFTELPKEVQERFHYDSEKAVSYSAEQAANFAAYQKQEQEAQHEREDMAAKNKAAAAQQQADTNRIQVLQDRYAALQQEEDALLHRIGEAKQPGPGYWVGKKLHHYPNPQASQLPFLQSHLSDVRSEKKQIQRQLEKAQR
jgi:hypothetical protein